MLNFLPSLFGAASSFLPTDEAPPPAPSAFQFRPRPLSTPAPQMGADPASYDAAYASWMQGLLNGTGATGTMTGVDSALAGFQGVADQMLGRPGQLGQSSDYYAGLTSGGTGAQNARFERMYDPRFAQEAAAQSLAVDPQFGHLFGGGNAGVTQLGGPVPGTVDDTYSEVAGRLKSDYSPSSAGYKMGGLAGVKLSPQLQSQALQNRLDQRADSAAALENMRVGPMDFVNPLDRMAAAYEWEAMNREFQAQQEKNLLAKTLAQAEIDARNAALSQDASQFDRNMDFREMQARMQGQATSAQNAFTQGMERQKLGLLERELGMQEAAAAREGQLTQKDTLELLFGTVGQNLGFDEALRRLNSLEAAGFNFPGLESIAPIAAAPAGAALPATLLPADLKAELATMSPDQQVQALRLRGKSDPEITAFLDSMNPTGVGVSATDPYGSSRIWELLRFHPANPLFLDTMLGGGFQKAMGDDPSAAQIDMFGQPIGLNQWLKPSTAAPAPTASRTFLPETPMSLY